MPIDHNKNVIEVSSVSFFYTPNDLVLDKVSLNLHKGDYLGIIGPNGGGKSTLLKIMLGLLKPTKGSVRIFGQDLKNFKDWSKIGYVPQRTGQFESSFPATVEEVVEMGRYAKAGLLKGLSKTDKSEVKKALERVGMLEYKERLIGQLSGGQQQRVFIARALVTEPEIIFLDEPTAGVDVKTQKEFYTLLRKLNKELNLTLVLISHELDVVAHEASEICYLNRIIDYYGEPMKLLEGEYFHKLIGKGATHHA